MDLATRLVDTLDDHGVVLAVRLGLRALPLVDLFVELRSLWPQRTATTTWNKEWAKTQTLWSASSTCARRRACNSVLRGYVLKPSPCS